jgi:hypothetical protein
MSDQFLEQRINSKFCVKLGKNASDTCELFSEAYGGKAVRKSSVSEWHKLFKQDRENMDDDERSGRPRFHRTDEKVEKGRDLVHSDRCLSIRNMTVQLNLDKGIITSVEEGLNFGPS